MEDNCTTQFNQGFHLKGGPSGIFLIHGLTGSAKQMRSLGHRLHQEYGFEVAAPLLTGHGLSPEALSRVPWTHWYESCFQALESMQARHIHFVGVSMGALLAIELMRRTSVHAVSFTAAVPPLKLKYPWQTLATYLFQNTSLCQWLPTFSKNMQTPQDQASYDSHSTRALGEMRRLIRHLKSDVPRLSPSTLFISAGQDEVVSLRSEQELLRLIQCDHHESLHLPASRHRVTAGPMQEEFERGVKHFIAREEQSFRNRFRVGA